MWEAIVSILGTLGVLGGSISVGIAVYGVSMFFDWFFPQHTKERLARRLGQRPTSPWSGMVIEMNDRVFVGRKPSLYNRPGFGGRVAPLSFGHSSCFLRSQCLAPQFETV